MWKAKRIAFVAIASTALAAPTAVGAAPRADYNEAHAEATAKRISDYERAFDFDRYRSRALKQVNHATAYTNLNDGRAVGIAFDVNLFSFPSGVIEVDVENTAVAFSDTCGCETLAMAFQWTVASDTPLRLTDAGKEKLEDVREELADLQRDNKDLEREGGRSPASRIENRRPLDEIEARVNELAAEVDQVIGTELVFEANNRRGKAGERADDDDKKVERRGDKKRDGRGRH